jgi:acyl-CoA synthetase (AMP-forming)/AMP-acid ligase II
MGSRSSSHDVQGLPNSFTIEVTDSVRGYTNNEEATRDTFAGEWLKTGDILEVDRFGNFYVTDRIKEV